MNNFKVGNKVTADKYLQACKEGGLTGYNYDAPLGTVFDIVFIDWGLPYPIYIKHNYYLSDLEENCANVPYSFSVLQSEVELVK